MQAPVLRPAPSLALSFLPFARPTIDDAMIAAVAETLRSRWITTGPRSAAFEQALSERFGGRPVRAFTSATAAMQVALEMLEIGPGDEVIAPAQSFFVTGNVVERCRATTVFVDVDLRSRNLDLAQAAAAVTPRTKVLLPTHYNAPLDPDALAAFRERHGVRILEDAALAIGSRSRDGRPVGSTGDLVTFSFHPNKNMTTIEGGALVLNDAREAALVEELRFHGIRRQPDGTRDVERAGGKSNFSDVSAALGLLQLRHLDEWCRTRVRLVQRYFDCLERDDLLSPECLPPKDNPGHSWNMFTLLLPLERTGGSRKAFIDAMHQEGIGIGISYEAIHLTSLFRAKGLREGMFPNSERIARETVTLPLYPEMHEFEVERVCASVSRVLRRKAA
jgi:dTDP-4-amino-4,6-dideoxygalactose transaminase